MFTKLKRLVAVVSFAATLAPVLPTGASPAVASPPPFTVPFTAPVAAQALPAAVLSAGRAVSFSDVPASNPHRAAIIRQASNTYLAFSETAGTHPIPYGYIRGNTAGKFRPDAPLTRHAAAVAVYRWMQMANPYGPRDDSMDTCTFHHVRSVFTDVPASSAGCWAIRTLRTHGVTTAAGEFTPDNAVTRGVFLTWLDRSMAGEYNNPPSRQNSPKCVGTEAPYTKTQPFPDVSPTSPYCEAIMWARQTQITGPAATFSPNAKLTRQTAAVWLDRTPMTG